MYGLMNNTEVSRLAMEIAQMAINAPNPGAVLEKYKLMPNYRLAAFLADGMVQANESAAKNQQALQRYNPNEQPVLDKLQMGQQGVAAIPTTGHMFDPSLYAQGGIGAGIADDQEQPVMRAARGGVVAFAGKGPSLVGSTGIPGGDLTVDEFIDEIQRQRVIEGIERSRDAARAAAAGEGVTPPKTITPENDVGLRRAIEQGKARAAAAAGTPSSPSGLSLETPAEANARVAGRPVPTPTAAPAGIPAAAAQANIPTTPAAAATPDKAQFKLLRDLAKINDKIAAAVDKGGNVEKLVAERARLQAVLDGMRSPTPGAAAGPTPGAAAGPTPGAAAGPTPGAAPNAAPGEAASRTARAVNSARSGISSLSRIAKWGGLAPTLAPIAYGAGYAIGNQLNEYTPIQEGIRSGLDLFGLASSSEDRANAAFQPGYIEGLMQQRKAANTAGVDPMVASIADNISKNEAGGAFLDPKSLGRSNPDNTSFGSIQFDVKGGLPDFVKTYGQEFGLTATLGTPEFAKQWKAAAEKDPVKFGAAQLKMFETNYLAPTRTALSSVLPGNIDPRVLSYFADRAVQLGAGSTRRDSKAIANAYNAANGDVASFLDNMNAYDDQNYPKYFATEASKPDSDRSKYNRGKNQARLAQRRDIALGTSPMERFIESAGKAVDTGKEIADVVAQQPAVEGLANIAQGLRTKGADTLERILPIRTGLEPPAKSAAPATPSQPTAQEQYMQSQAQDALNKARQMTSDKQDQRDIAVALMQAGFSMLGSTSPYASVGFGQGATKGLETLVGLQQKREERAAKAEEKAKDRAEKYYKDTITAELGRLKNMLPDFDTNPDKAAAIAQLNVLRRMPRDMRYIAGYDDYYIRSLEKQIASYGSTLAKSNDKWGQVTVGKS